MPTHNSKYLLDRLLSNTLPGAELDVFLMGLHDPVRAQAYSDILQAHFNQLLLEYSPQTASDGFPDQPGKPPASTGDTKYDERP